MHNNACSFQFGFRYRVGLNRDLLLQVGGIVRCQVQLRC